MLATPPQDVKLLFDDEIRPAGGDRVVDAKGRSVLAGPAHRLAGNDRALVLPLRAGLARGAYTVRWRVVSNDGHLVAGVLAFAVGAGSPRPVPTLSAGGGVSTASVVLRFLFIAGVLVAGGAALTGRVLLEPGRRRLETAVVGAGLVLIAAGGLGLLAIEPAADATRFGRVTETAAIVALVGAAAALASIVVPTVAVVASGAAVLELVAPTLAGHALDPRNHRGLIALADFVHVAAAAVWIGGLVLLVASGSLRARRRFPTIAIGAVLVLGAASIPRAIAAFPTLASVVHTSYGQTLLVEDGRAPRRARRRLGEPAPDRARRPRRGARVAGRPGSRDRGADGAPAAAAGGRVGPGRTRRSPAAARGRGRARRRGRRRRCRARRFPARAKHRGARHRARPGRQGHRRADGQDRRGGGPAVRAGLLCRDDPGAAAAADRRRRPLRPRREARDPPLRPPAPLARPGRGGAGHTRRPRLPLIALARHPRAPGLERPERNHHHLPRSRAGQARLLDHERAEGRDHRRHPLGQAPGREMGAVADGADQAAGAVLGDRRTNAHLLGTGTVDGRPVRIASFYDPHLPAWFVLSIEPRTAGCSRCT